MTQIMYDIPSDPSVYKVIITEDCIKNGAQPEVLRDPERLERPFRLGGAALQEAKQSQPESSEL